MSDQHEEYPPAESIPPIRTGEPSAEPGTVPISPSAPPPAHPEATIVAAPPAAGDEQGAEDETSAESTVPADDVPGSESAPSLEQDLVEDDVSDPFRDWPQPEGAAVIEDIPEEGAVVAHVAGEIDVPDGYTVLEGTPSGHRRSVAIVVSRYNGGLTNRMLARAIETLEDAGVSADAVTIMPVPGAFELPLAAMALAKTRRYACVVALGAIVRGETPHFDYIASEAASGLQLAAIETGVPVAFGVLTVETIEQAEARIDRAADAVRTALEMADAFAQLRASARI